ncbi:MAG: BBP7 family outer membrane beta-barrel protein [Planctomycetales bacterium]|nr:BBP7 family outer membrane beta-barrel protein [Planctomycetales bacterium]
MKIIRALAITILLAANSRGAAAQETLVPPNSGAILPPMSAEGMSDLPPVSELIPSPVDSDEGESLPLREGGRLEGSMLEGLAPLGVNFDGGFDNFVGSCPALLESSGTWLRRGFWYAELDAMLLNRQWDKHDWILASENQIGTVRPELSQGSVFVGNQLSLGSGKPGVEALPRVTVGAFLFRDADNRDHNAEFTWFGAGEFMQHGELTAVGSNGLQVTDFIDRSALSGAQSNPTFDGATSMAIDYNHTLDSFEFNYAVKRRMRRDQMVLRPDGQWVRQANNTRTLAFLAGLRMFNIREQLNWDAVGVPDSANNGANTATGNYRVDVDNDLLGLQLGGSFGLETGRWSLLGHAKMGAYLNQIDLNSGFGITANDGSDLGSGGTNSTADTLATVGQFGVTGRWHLRPNMSLRAGVEMLWVDSIAVAPFQVNFIPGNYPSISQAADSVYMGVTMGWESYW